MVALLLFVFALGAAPPGLVLCVAEGDHLAIEPACELELQPCGAPELAGERYEALPIEACTDTPLFDAAALRSSPDAPVASLVAVLPHVPHRIHAPISLRASERAHARGADLRAIRTIVLRV